MLQDILPLPSHTSPTAHPITCNPIPSYTNPIPSRPSMSSFKMFPPNFAMGNRDPELSIAASRKFFIKGFVAAHRLSKGTQALEATTPNKQYHPFLQRIIDAKCQEGGAPAAPFSVSPMGPTKRAVIEPCRSMCSMCPCPCHSPSPTTRP